METARPATLAPPSMLTADEEEFVHNLEILGLPLQRAAQLAGMDVRKARQPHIVEACNQRRREMLGRLRITKEDSAAGILDAIDRARIIGEPSTEIAGWKEINAMYGHNAPKEVNLQVNATVEVLQKQIRNVPTSDLVKLLGAGDVIDGEFYER